jgi:hypothetical protein
LKEEEMPCLGGLGKWKCKQMAECVWQDSECQTVSTSDPVDSLIELVPQFSVLRGTFHHIAVDTDFVTPVRLYLIDDVESGVNVELDFVGGVPADAAEAPIDGTFATAVCINLLPVPIVGSGRFGTVKCIVADGGFSLTTRARSRRAGFTEGGRPGITMGTRTWIVTMLQIPGEHNITEEERLVVSL